MRRAWGTLSVVLASLLEVKGDLRQPFLDDVRCLGGEKGRGVGAEAAETAAEPEPAAAAPVTPKNAPVTPKNAAAAAQAGRANADANVGRVSLRASYGGGASERDVGTNAQTKLVDCVGTTGYQAYEVVCDKMLPRDQRRGYGSEADYFSLGVVAHELLTGKVPFRWRLVQRGDRHEFVRVAPLRNDLSRVHGPREELLTMHAPLRFPPTVSPAAADLIASLLDRDPATRCSLDSLRNHEWVAGIDWNALVNREIAAPYCPPKIDLDLFTAAQFKDFDEVMASFDELDRQRGHCGEWGVRADSDGEKMFAAWNYVHPDTVKIEVGVAEVNTRKRWMGVVR